MSLITAGYQIRLAPRSDLWVSALIIQGSNSKQLQEGPDLSIDQQCLLYIQFEGHLLDLQLACLWMLLTALANKCVRNVLDAMLLAVSLL